MPLAAAPAFRDPAPPTSSPIRYTTLFRALQAEMAGQLASLDDLAEATGSSSEPLGVSAALLTEKLATHLLREILVRGASGGPLAPLARQLEIESVRELVGHLLDPGTEARAERTVDIALLTDSMEGLREAVAATPADHPDRAVRLTNLGIAVWALSERTGDLAAADEAVWAFREATHVTPAGDPDRPRYLSNPGSALQIRFERIGQAADLEEAIAADREAVNAALPDDPARPDPQAEVKRVLLGGHAGHAGRCAG